MHALVAEAGCHQKTFRMNPKMYVRIAKIASEEAAAMILYLFVIRNLREARWRGFPNSSFGIFCFTKESQKTCDGFASGVSLSFLESAPIFVWLLTGMRLVEELPA